MNQRPILFSGAMVRALLDGSKTQTRRIVKKQPFERPGKHDHRMGYISGRAEKGDEIDGFYAHTTCAGGEWQAKCPYGQPGDQLWVRETWSHDAESLEACRATVEDAMPSHAYGPYYRATESAPETLSWKPSIHMPRWVSRIQLEITGVRVERLQDISIADAMAEGVEQANKNMAGVPPCMEWRYAYEDLWRSINGVGSWDKNPWVWVVEFKRVKP